MKKLGLLLALFCSIFASAQTKAPALLDKSDFETEIDGKKVSLYTITNGRVTAQVTNLADAPACPTGVRIANANELDNNTRLTWNPILDKNGRPDLSVTYQVLCRETDKSEWLPALPLGLSDTVPASDKPEFYYPLSKDNYYFAIRAVSADGCPGLPAVAK